MKPFKKLLIVFAVSVIIFLPQQVSWACGPWPALPEDFRLSLFDPAVYDKSAEFSPYYFSLNTYYKHDSPNDFASQIENDQNYNEWQQQLKRTPFSKQDFYEAVNTCDYAIVADSSNELRKSNSFVDALLHRGNEAYFNYFRLAKSTEVYNGDRGTNLWGLDSYSDVSDSVLYQITQELKHTRNPFIRQHTAYLLCRLFFYNNDAKNLQAVYNKYFNGRDMHSWVKASAKYYSITALYGDDSSFSKEYCRALVDVIDRSKDKRLPCIRQLLEQPRQRVLSLLSNPHAKATAIAAFAVRNPGYGLADMKQIYSLDPGNQFLPLLLNREINKMEDWLLTPVLTEFGAPATRDGYWEWTSDSAREKTKENLVKDEQYASRMIAFANRLNTRHRYDASLCHLYFLQKNWTAAGQYCNRVLQSTGKASPQHLQARINHVIIGLQKVQQVSPFLQKEIYSLLTDLDEKDRKQQPAKKDNDYYGEAYNSGFTLRDDLLVYLGRTALRMHDVVNASLLLSGTYKPWGEYTTGSSKNAYFLLYEHGRDSDFTMLLSILHKKYKTPYENYFLKRKTDAEGNYTFSDARTPWHKSNISFFWDANKMLNIEGTHFIKKDNLPKALQAFRQIPDTFWTSRAYWYKDYMTGNPFTLNLYNTHEYQPYDSSPKPGNPNKAQFVQKLIALKEKLQHTTDKEQKARLCYAIGNAYYSMSYYGKFWMMSKLWWETYERDNLEINHLSPFDLQYYTAERAKPYYLQAMQLTNNPKKAAFYCMYLSHCENKEKDLAEFLSYKKKSPDRWYSGYDYHYNAYLYTRLLKQRSGSYSFYKQIVDECPLYKDFRDKMERGL